MTADEYYEMIREDRETWRASVQDVCMSCGAEEVNSWPGLQIHEIERRSQAPKAWGELCNYLLLCPTCHMGPFATMAHDRQLACKLISDPNNFDLEEWMRIRDPVLTAPYRVLLQDVVKHLRMTD